MPTEVTPAPFRFEQQFPIALERNIPYGPSPHASSTPPIQIPNRSHVSQPPSGSHSNMAALGWSSVPPTGPARMAECMPNKVLPSGIRNPWAPYAGEVYRPSAEKAENMAHGHFGASLGGAGMAPQSFAQTHMGGSIVAPSGFSAGMSLGGSLPGAASGRVRRVDDGWDGSSGRAHVGHMPDPTSTAGRLGRTTNPAPQGGNWLLAPSSYQNHARMTPSLAYDAPPTVYLAPPVHSNSHSNGPPLLQPQAQSLQPQRASVGIPISGACQTCTGSDGLSRRGSISSPREREGHRRIPNSPHVGSPLRHIGELPRAEAGRDEGLQRKISSASRKSRDGGRRGYSECSACG